MKLSNSSLLGAVALLAISATLAGAQVRMTVAPQSQPVVLRGATIHTVTNGTITNGMIVLDGGKITAIGQNVEVPRGARVVDVTGKHIYPGLIDAYSTVGITEIGSVDVSNDINEIGDFNPNVRAEVAVNAESRHIGTTRSAGVLVAFTTPGGGVISGLSSAMSLEGWTWEEMSLKGRCAQRELARPERTSPSLRWPRAVPRCRAPPRRRTPSRCRS
jgi:imidazolonepropionase-like amidohydrolase